MIKRYNSRLEVYYELLKKELEKCEDLLAEMNMENMANPTPNIGADIDEFYDLDDFVLEINMYNKEDIYEEDNKKEVEKDMIVQIIEELGYDSEQFEDQISYIEFELYFNGHMWDVKDDIVMNILDNAFMDVDGVCDVDGMCDIIGMLEDKFGYNEYLHYAINFRDIYGPVDKLIF